MEMETTGAQNILPEQDAQKKGMSPSIMMASTTNLIRIQSDLKDQVDGEYEFRNT
jgi:hypothetical protein